MDALKLICIVRISDSSGESKEESLQASLARRSQYDSDLIMTQLRSYAKNKEIEMKLTNKDSYDDFWLLDFLSNGKNIESVQFNLRRMDKICTEWGLWTIKSSEFTDGIREFLTTLPTFDVR